MDIKWTKRNKHTKIEYERASMLLILVVLGVAVQATPTPPPTASPTSSPTSSPTMAPTACMPNDGNLTEIPVSYTQLTTVGGCSGCTKSESDFVISFWDNPCWRDDWRSSSCPDYDSWSVFAHGGLFTVLDDSRERFLIEIEPTTSKVDLTFCTSRSWTNNLLVPLPVGDHCSSILFYSDDYAACSAVRIDCTEMHGLFNVTTSSTCTGDDNGLSGGELIGIIAGTILGVMLVIMVMAMMCCESKPRYTPL